MNWGDALLILVKDKEMTKEMYRVLLVLLAKGEGDRSVCFTQSELGHVTEMRQQNVYRSLKALESKGYIKVERDKRPFCYRLNQHFGFDTQ
jgi:DNA-binding MarR family transcriptional regulator